MVNEGEKRIWTAPKLEQLAMAETAVKGEGSNESGMSACGPAAGGGAQDKCS